MSASAFAVPLKESPPAAASRALLLSFASLTGSSNSWPVMRNSGPSRLRAFPFRSPAAGAPLAVLRPSATKSGISDSSKQTKWPPRVAISLPSLSHFRISCFANSFPFIASARSTNACSLTSPCRAHILGPRPGPVPFGESKPFGRIGPTLCSRPRFSAEWCRLRPPLRVRIPRPRKLAVRPKQLSVLFLVPFLFFATSCCLPPQKV